MEVNDEPVYKCHIRSGLPLGVGVSKILLLMGTVQILMCASICRCGIGLVVNTFHCHGLGTACLWCPGPRSGPWVLHFQIRRSLIRSVLLSFF